MYLCVAYCADTLNHRVGIVEFVSTVYYVFVIRCLCVYVLLCHSKFITTYGCICRPAFHHLCITHTIHCEFELVSTTTHLYFLSSFDFSSGKIQKQKRTNSEESADDSVSFTFFCFSVPLPIDLIVRKFPFFTLIFISTLHKVLCFYEEKK